MKLNCRRIEKSQLRVLAGFHAATLGSVHLLYHQSTATLCRKQVIHVSALLSFPALRNNSSYGRGILISERSTHVAVRLDVCESTETKAAIPPPPCHAIQGTACAYQRTGAGGTRAGRRVADGLRQNDMRGRGLQTIHHKPVDRACGS